MILYLFTILGYLVKSDIENYHFQNRCSRQLAMHLYILEEINLAISDKAGCLSDLLTEWEII